MTIASDERMMKVSLVVALQSTNEIGSTGQEDCD